MSNDFSSCFLETLKISQIPTPSYATAKAEGMTPVNFFFFFSFSFWRRAASRAGRERHVVLSRHPTLQFFPSTRTLPARPVPGTAAAGWPGPQARRPPLRGRAAHLRKGRAEPASARGGWGKTASTAGARRTPRSQTSRCFANFFPTGGGFTCALTSPPSRPPQPSNFWSCC